MKDHDSPSADAVSLSSVVQDSLKQNEKAATVPVKSRKAAVDGESPPVSGPGEAAAMTDSPPPPPYEVPTPLIRAGIGIPVRLLGRLMGVNDGAAMRLTDSDIEELQPVVNQAANHYFPADGSGPANPGLILALTVVLLAVGKAEEANANKKAIEEKPKLNQEPWAVQSAQAQNGVAGEP